MVIGVTGQIGAGKSTAAEIMAEHGAYVIDADQIGREVVEENNQLLGRLAREFGNDILDRRGVLNRARLAEVAFADRDARKKLNDIVHPFLLGELHRRLEQAQRKEDFIVIDAALLLYWDMDDDVDYVLVVHAGEETRFKRVKKRGISKADARARQRSQLPFSEFQRRADKVIMNNGTRKDLERKVLEFLRRIDAPV